VHNEFVVLESENALRQQDSDRFGYRSQHYIVKIKEGWLNAPNYRGLKDFVAEIQVRTILMHAWADISHKLAYKEESQIPLEFRRQVHQLSALFELADQQFDRLRDERASYRQRLTTSSADKLASSFDLKAPLNYDSLKAFLSFYFGDRETNDNIITGLLDQLKQEQITFEDIVLGYNRLRNLIQKHEQQNFPDGKGWWNQGGVVRYILDMTRDKWWNGRVGKFPDRVVELRNSQRKEFNVAEAKLV